MPSAACVPMLGGLVRCGLLRMLLTMPVTVTHAAASVSSSALAEEFPTHWGSPPAVAATQQVALPGGYGHGSFALAYWIAEHMAEDRRVARIRYPRSWGEPPAFQTKDQRPLPFGYGMGSGFLAKWIALKAQTVSGEELEEYEATWGDMGSADPDFALACSSTGYPSHWTGPPANGTGGEAAVPLPGGYGYGSLELAAWIKHNLEADRSRGEVVYPPAWGKPPKMQTFDLVSLPFGYHVGSGTLRSWIEERARDCAGEDPSEYKRVWPAGCCGDALGNETAFASDAAQLPGLYPARWGVPPELQVSDYVPLPGGYGRGSSTLARWIQRRMLEDTQADRPAYPPAWGAPPPADGEDELSARRPLPFGYGWGSPTLAAWIEDSAAKYSGESPEEYGKHGRSVTIVV